jgi:E3 ubiquitin-protein ligase makorin
MEEEEEEEEEDGDVDSTLDEPVLETSIEELRPEPPFVTDGRGRVVWTSPGEEDKTSRPTEEQTGEPASRSEVASGSGGLLGWFNALF